MKRCQRGAKNKKKDIKLKPPSQVQKIPNLAYQI